MRLQPVTDPDLLAQLEGGSSPAADGGAASNPLAGVTLGTGKPAETWHNATPEEIAQARRDPTKDWKVNDVTGEWVSQGERGAAIGEGGIDESKLTDAERTAAFLATRVAGGIQDLNRAVGEDAGAAQPGPFEAFTGVVAGPEARHAVSDDVRRRVEDAQLDILDAALTLGTGAAYTREQLQNYRSSYFPTYLDDAATIADKKARMARLLEGAKLKAGRAAPAVDRALAFVMGDVAPGEEGLLPATEASRGAQGQLTAGPLQLPGQPPGPPPSQPPPPGPGDIGFSGNVPPTQAPMTDAQATAYNAFMAANPTATAEQIQAFGQGLGIPIENAAEIVAAREAGAGFQPGETAVPGATLTPEEQAIVSKELEGSGAIEAAGRGATTAIPFTDEVGNAIIATVEAMQGKGSFGERFEANERINKAVWEGSQEQNPYAYAGGQIAGAMAIPTGVMNSGRVAATAVIRAGGTRAEAINAARTAAAQTMAKEGTAYGGALGAGEGEGVGGRLASGVTGATIGGATGGALGLAGKAAAPVTEKLAPAAGRVAEWWRKPGGGVDEVDIAAARAGQELGMDIPKFVVGGPAARGKASALEQAGQKQITEATSKMLDEAEAARGKIAGEVGTAQEDIAMGETAVAAGKEVSKTEKQRIGNLYTQAHKGAEGVSIPANKTLATLRQIAASESQAIGGSKVGDKFAEMANQLDELGGLTVEGARQTRTSLRDTLMSDVGLTRSNATRLTTVVMKALGEDMDAGLKAAGKEEVGKLFRQADTDWRRLQILEDRVLEPYIGKEGEAFGDEVAKRLATDVKGRGIRLAKFLNAVPEEQANSIRASLIERLGTPKAGQQGAAGEGFSLDTFLTNWNEIKNSRRLIFLPETVKSLNRLAEVGEAAKRASKARGHSNTGRTISAVASGAAPFAGAGAGYSLSESGWGGVAGSIIAPLLMAGAKGRSARLLSSPKFAEKLARTPRNPKAARSFWSRPWVEGLARANPQIANEVLGFRQGVLDMLDQQIGAEQQSALAQ